MDIRARVGLAVTAVVAYAVLSHALMTRAPDSALSLAVVLGPMVLAALASLWHIGRRAVAWLSTFGVVAVLIAIAHGSATVPMRWLYLGQHIGIHAALALGFGITLRRNVLPLITQLASRVHPLSADMRLYTRRVTLAWTIYFIAVCGVSLALYASTSFDTWSLFSNIGTPLSLGAMFVGEHLLRYRLHPEFERIGMLAAMRAYMQHRSPAAESGA